MSLLFVRGLGNARSLQLPKKLSLVVGVPQTAKFVKTRTTTFTTKIRNMPSVFTMEEVDKHDSEGDFWVVVESFVLDLSDFLRHHPGGARRIVNKRKELRSSDITSNFVDHFGHTVKAFRAACKEFDRFDGTPVKLNFNETGDDVAVLIIGKIVEKK